MVGVKPARASESVIIAGKRRMTVESVINQTPIHGTVRVKEFSFSYFFLELYVYVNELWCLGRK